MTKQNDTKISNASKFIQRLLKCKNKKISRLLFVRGLLIESGSTIIKDYFDSSYDASIEKIISNRGINKNIYQTLSNGFNENNCIKYLKNNLTNDSQIYEIFNLLNYTKNFDVLCISLTLKFKEFIFEDDHLIDIEIEKNYSNLISTNKKESFYVSRVVEYNYLSNNMKEIIEEYVCKIMKYKKNTTLFYDKVSREFYDVYVCNDVYMELNDKNHSFNRVENICIETLHNNSSNFFLLEASGGLGKTMMIQHLLLSSCKKFNSLRLIPLQLNLRDYDNQNIFDYLYDKFNLLVHTPLTKEEFSLLLSNGQFVFLLDGIDEIFSDYIINFKDAINSFCIKYNRNIFVLSTRPCQTNSFLNLFTLITLQPFNKLQAIQLIKNVTKNDKDENDSFIRAINRTLFNSHRDFCENPLLLIILFKTYSFNGIPENKHEFFERAYYTLSKKYDSLTEGKSNCLYTKLTPNRFLDYLCQFSFIGYYNMKYEYSLSEFVSLFESIKLRQNQSFEIFTAEDFLRDLVEKLCLFIKDGDKYHFIHRSFQEFFCAKYFSKQSYKKYIEIGKYIDKRNYNEIPSIKNSRIKLFSHSIRFEEYVYDMLYTMNHSFFEELIILPALKNVIDLKLGDSEDGFLYFLSKAYDTIEYTSNSISINPIPISNSVICSKLLKNFNKNKYLKNSRIEDFFLSFNINGDYPTLKKCDLGFTCDEQMQYIINVFEVTDINDPNYHGYAGTLYSFTANDLLNNRDLYSGLIFELMNSILFHYFIYLKNIYIDLMKKYAYKKKTT